MVNEGSLARTSNKEYTPGTGEPKYAEDSEDNRRPSATSRRKATYDDDESRVHRGVLSPDGNDWWQVTDSSTGKVYQMAHRSKVPGDIDTEHQHHIFLREVQCNAVHCGHVRTGDQKQHHTFHDA